jgi:zinc protease
VKSLYRALSSLAILASLLIAAACSSAGPAPAPQPVPAPAPVAAQAPAPAPAATAPAAAESTVAMPDPATAPLSTPLPIDPAVRTGQLDNGFHFYLRRNTRPQQRAHLWLAVNAGSVLEDDDQQGLAHFVEHMAFNGTRHFEKQALVNYLQSIGMRFGPDVNAYTNFDETVYMLQLPTDNDEVLAKAFEILEDWAHGISFEGEEIDKERGVVMEEWRLSRGAGARLFDRQYPVLLAGSKYAERLPIGKPEILENAPYDALRRYYRDWYRPELMALVAVGDFDLDAVEALTREHFAPLENPPAARPREAVAVPLGGERKVSIETDPEATSTAITLYRKQPRPAMETLADYRRDLVEILYTWIVDERLAEVAQQPDPPFIGAGVGSSEFARSVKFATVGARVEQGGVLTGLEALLTELERVRRHGVTDSELERAKKDMLRTYEQAAQEQDKLDSGRFAQEYAGHFLHSETIPGIAFEVALARRFVPEITRGEVEAVDAALREGSEVILVSGPSEQVSGLPEEAELIALFDAVEGREIEPYADRVLDRPLLAELPEPGRIVSESTIDELALTEWTLSNGVRVMVRPTDFQNDQVILTGYSPGGNSLVADEDHPSALFATTVLDEGGLGEFTRVELDKALAGKVANVGAYIQELEEGVNGFASPQDLETLFQLLYLRFTAPRPDAAAFQSFVQRAGALIANRLASPGVVFGDRFAEVVSQGHPRRRPLSAELLSEVDLDRATRVYRDRFADASDFTFILVGNLDLASLRPLVERYLGGLPSLGREESWRDVGVEPPKGAVEFEVRKGLEPQSQVSLLMTGDAEFNRQQLHALSTLGQAFNDRLREVLREDLSGTYGVNVAVSLAQEPHQRYSVSITFGCAPDRARALIDRVFEEMAAARENGLDAVYLQRVEEAQLRGRETSLRENGFWLQLLKTYDTAGFDRRLILDFEPLVEAFDVEDLHAAAQRYLDPKDYVLGILYPETGPDGAAATEPETAGEEAADGGQGVSRP